MDAVVLLGSLLVLGLHGQDASGQSHQNQKALFKCNAINDYEIIKTIKILLQFKVRRSNIYHRLVHVEEEELLILGDQVCLFHRPTGSIYTLSEC